MKDKLTSLEKSWVLYDVGNSAFTLMISTIIPIFFKNYASSEGMSAANSTAIWSYTLSIATAIVAVLGPVLGRMADEKGKKRKFFTFFLIMGCIGCFVLGIVQQWILYLLVFLVARVGYSSSLVFYDSMLTDVTTDDRVDRVSSSGFAWGYIGSCIPFILCLLLVLMPDTFGITMPTAIFISFTIVTVWWFGSAVPLLKQYRQNHYNENIEKKTFASIYNNLKLTLHKVRQNKTIATFLIAYFFYIDGVFTIIEMATSYGKDVGISDTDLVLALLLTQVVAFPFAILYGRLAKKFETKKLICSCIGGYILIVLFALQLDKAWEFWFLAVCVAVFQGAIQALSRSYFARIIPKDNSNEYFGFYDIFGKGAAFFGTLMMGIVTQATGSSTYGVATLLILLVVGLYFMFKVPSVKND